MELRARTSSCARKAHLQEAVDALFDNGAAAAFSAEPTTAAEVPQRYAQGKQGVSPESPRQAVTTRPLRHRGRPGAKAPSVRIAQEDGARAYSSVHAITSSSAGHCTTIQQAKEMVEQTGAVVWDILEDVIREHP